MNFYFLLITIGIANITYGRNFTLKELVDKNFAEVIISPNEKSTHYHSPLVLSVENNSMETITVKIPNGDVLEPIDDTYQRFIVTEAIHLVINPLQKESTLIKGMCIDHFKAAPSDNLKYVASNHIPSSIEKKMTVFIEENQFFEPNAQFLLWDILASPKTYSNVEQFKIIDNEITPMIRDNKNNLVSISPKNDYYEEYEVLKEVSGSFTMELASPKNIHIAMFDTNNILVKELYKNPSTPKGETSLEYAFNSLAFQEDTCFIKLVMDGNILMNRKIDLSIN
jgi:hypothetical protein